jgi:hypothetical protein
VATGLTIAAIAFLKNRILEMPGIRLTSNRIGDCLSRKRLYMLVTIRISPSAEKPFANYSHEIDMAATHIPYRDAALVRAEHPSHNPNFPRRGVLTDTKAGRSKTYRQAQPGFT